MFDCSSTGRCPVDENVLGRSDVTVDKQMQRELDHLGVKCNYFEQGCSWTGLAIELPDHLDECQCRLVQCIYDCGVEFEVGYNLLPLSMALVARELRHAT